MHFDRKTKKKLIENWGDRAEAMDCLVEVKYIDELSRFACYIYALNPEDEDEIACIIHTGHIDVCKWSLRELQRSYNGHGDNPIIDSEFRSTLASTLLKKLKDSEGI